MRATTQSCLHTLISIFFHRYWRISCQPLSSVFHVLKNILQQRRLATSVGDEGGFARNLNSNADAIETIIQAIEKAGYKPGEDIAIALDSAANSFAVDMQGSYDLKSAKRKILSWRILQLQWMEGT